MVVNIIRININREANLIICSTQVREITGGALYLESYSFPFSIPDKLE